MNVRACHGCVLEPNDVDRIADLTVEKLLILIREELRRQPVAAPRHQAALGTRTATGGWLVRRAEAPQP